MISTNAFIIWYWVITLTIAIGLIGGAAIKGWRDGCEKLVWWRGVKLISSAIGVVGLILLLLNFETLVREMSSRSKAFVDDEFLEAKFYATHLKAVACSKDMSEAKARNECFDFTNIDNQISFARLREGREFSTITNWQRNPALTEAITTLNRKLAFINSAVASANERQFLAFDMRLSVAMLSTILVIVAVAGSIGDATYQYRQARLRAT
jgi:hypothetical protein